MEILVVIGFILLVPIIVYLRWKIGTQSNFDHLFKKQLSRHGLKLIKSEYPGIFKVGPFKKFEIELGKPQINDGAIQYERNYIRKLQILNKDKEQIEIWARIETGWFKETTAEFNPNLKEIK